MGVIQIQKQDQLKIAGVHLITLRHIKTGEIKTFEFHNIVTSVGKNMIAKRLAGEGNSCVITYGAVGTGSSSPAQGDTALDTELFRKVLSSRSAAGNQSFFIQYYGPQEANGDLKELALFGEDADETPDSGTMFNHATINVTKTSSYTMTIESIITYT